jgi:hypothetical protein
MFTLTDIAEIVTLISLCMGAVWALGVVAVGAARPLVRLRPLEETLLSGLRFYPLAAAEPEQIMGQRVGLAQRELSKSQNIISEEKLNETKFS